MVLILLMLLLIRTLGNGKIRIGLPGINKDIVLDANDIETFKQSLVK